MERRVFVTGASRGIGRAIADRFRAAGYHVMTPCRTEMDLSSVDSVGDYLKRNKRLNIDVLVNNAGENWIFPIKDLSVKDWQRIQTINLTSPFLLIQHVTPYMMSQRWGRIVSISSCYSMVGRAGRAAYSASKSGLNALTRAAALEYAEFNILVNAVCPGFVETDLTRRNNTPEQIADLCKQIPLRRLGMPEEVADFVFYLGSDQNSYITGQALIIDGGFMSQ
jgi:3-oxoacyl-[acyl-carrier protein] reductase